MESSHTNSLLVYAKHITPRLSYIVSTLFSNATVTDSQDRFFLHKGIKINYSADKINSDELWVVPYGLLTEQGIRKQAIDCFEWAGMNFFFATNGDLPFDIFSASFYLLTRYEEYLPHELDQYGRYSHTNSLAYKEGFLKLPLVNLWIQMFEGYLTKRNQNSAIRNQNSKFNFVPTYDIDIAYSYLHKPVWKNVAGFYRDLLQGKFEQVMERGNVYSGRKKDPFDVFDWMDSLHEKYRLQPIYFFLTILKRGKFDKNLLARSKALQQLYQRLSKIYITGLHPSWQSGTDEWLLGKELKTLENIIQKPVIISRNHYLRFTVPHSYRRLMAAGIKDDYSMAYGTINGFRASYTLPFSWYDLEQESVTGLVIHPFCFMEANSFFEQGYSAEEAGEEIQYYFDVVKKVNGEFITLFHNHFLTEQPEWIGWRRMYEDFLEKNFG